MNATQAQQTTPHLNDAQCADLVLELVAPESREVWLDHAAVCEACEARLKSHVSATARSRADWLARSPHSSSHWPPADWTGTRVWALAAAALLAVAVALPLIQTSPPSRAGAVWLPALGEPVRTREGNTEDPALTRGMAAYEARDLVNAQRELSAAKATGAAESMRRLYLADVRLNLGHPHESIELLRGLNWRSIPEPYRREGAVLLARALRAGGEAEAADSIESTLRAIPPGTPFLP